MVVTNRDTGANIVSEALGAAFPRRSNSRIEESTPGKRTFQIQSNKLEKTQPMRVEFYRRDAVSMLYFRSPARSFYFSVSEQEILTFRLCLFKSRS